MANKTRPINLKLRVDEAEHKLIKYIAKENGMTIQDYLLQSALHKQIIKKEIPTDELKELLLEMKRQGNNLNQLTRRLNERGFIDYKQELPQTLLGVREAWQQLRQLNEALQNWVKS